MANKIIDVDSIAAAVGVPTVTEDRDGRKFETLNWTPEFLVKGLEYIKPQLETPEPMTLTGSGVHWMMAAFAAAMGDQFTIFQYPHRTIEMYPLTMGEENPEGEIHFEVADTGDSLYVKFDPDDHTKPFPDGPHNYNMEKLPLVKVPPCRPDQHVFYCCAGPFNVFLNIVKTYFGKCKSLSVSPGHGDTSGYVCAYSNCDEIKVGDTSPFYQPFA